MARNVTAAPAIREYIVDLVNASRSCPEFSLGASPRGSLDLLKTSTRSLA
jgi:MoxR-like ATPase